MALFLSNSTCGYYQPPVLLSLCALSNHQTSSVVTFGKLYKAWNFFILHVLGFNWGLQTLFLLLSFASRLLPGAPDHTLNDFFAENFSQTGDKTRLFPLCCCCWWWSKSTQSVRFSASRRLIYHRRTNKPARMAWYSQLCGFLFKWNTSNLFVQYSVNIIH